jgi:heme-degrading monooxygenase HmoA
VNAGYVYVWEFVVAREHVRDFERAYGADGDWVELFRRASGYVRSELIRDRTRPERYLTVDYWESKALHDAFRVRFAGEFEALDAACAAFTISETEIGKFEMV